MEPESRIENLEKEVKKLKSLLGWLLLKNTKSYSEMVQVCADLELDIPIPN